MSGSFFQMVVGLVVVLAAIAATAWVARRMGMGGPHAARLLKIVSVLQVGAKERVVVVELEGQWMVLGVTPGRISALATLPRGTLPELAEPASAASPGTPPGNTFSALLRKARDDA